MRVTTCHCVSQRVTACHCVSQRVTACHGMSWCGVSRRVTACHGVRCIYIYIYVWFIVHLNLYIYIYICLHGRQCRPSKFHPNPGLEKAFIRAVGPGKTPPQSGQLGPCALGIPGCFQHLLVLDFYAYVKDAF